jgi:tetratricopeptide (TPR) repeat protein
MSIESLKATARRHEQNEEWQKALDHYGQAIARLDQEDQPDSGLHNRVGDLYVKVGNYEQAIEHYDRAIELYRDTYLLNNAIAVCKKIVRHVPGRNEVFRTMGQIRAEQGFTSDARENFLRYAELMQEAGDLDESFRALVEFADLVRDDVDVRITVADQMLANERVAEGVDQLKIAYQIFKQAERDDRAFGLEARLLELDPAVDFEQLAADAEVMTVAADDGFEYMTPFGEDEQETDGGADDAPAPVEHVSEDGAPDIEGVAEEPLRDADALEGALIEEPVGEAVSDAWEEAAASGDESAEDGREISVVEEVEQETTDRPLMEDPEGSAAEPALTEDAREDVAEFPVTEDAESETPELPLMEGAEDEASELPVIEDREEEAAEPPGVEDVGGGFELLLTEDGEGDAVELPVIEDLDESRPAELNGPGEEEKTGLPVMDLEPGDGDDSAALRGAMGTEPAYEDAGRLEAAAETASSAPAPTDAPSDEYVDLNSMIFGDEVEEPKSTRFRVQYEEPSGDEVADFQKMLSQFKEKVSENLDASDVRAHYDLGTAYKEMGLLDEAITEFQSALRAAADHLPTYELMGQTFLEMGKSEAAAKSLERALRIPTGVEDDLLGIYYYLARAYEMLGERESAVEFYDRVFSLDINFADVTERLRALR